MIYANRNIRGKNKIKNQIIGENKKKKRAFSLYNNDNQIKHIVRDWELYNEKIVMGAEVGAWSRWIRQRE